MILNRPFSADLLRFNPPRFAESVLHDLLAERYGITGSLKHLAGERDQNALVTTDSGTKYVLKIAGPDEPDETVDFQVQALLHLEKTDPGLVVPRQIADNSGAQAGILADDDGRPHWVRLVSFVEGEPLGEYDHLDSVTITSIGRIAGRLCAALAGFDHPAATNFMPWDELNGIIFADELRDYLPDSIRDMADRHLQRLEEESMRKLLSLPHQVIHHDAHPGNVMCEAGNPERITGVIDFGDLISRPVLMDISVALYSTLRHNTGILETTSAMLDGYAEHVTLSENMLALLYDALCASNIMCVQLLNYRAQHHADDPEKIRQEDFAGALDNARRFLAFDRMQFTEHVIRHHASA